MRASKHRHKVHLRVERPFGGSIESDKPNPRAHGWITVEQICRCGAVRFSNENQQEFEIGNWEASR